MIQIVSYAVPAELWQEQPRAPGALDVIQDLAQEVIAIRRRLEKHVNEDFERERYQETCELLEEAVQRAASEAVTADQFTKLVNANDYFEILASCWLARLASNDDAEATPAVPWLGASVIPPMDVPAHLATLKQASDPIALHLRDRIAFLQNVIDQRAGVVECQGRVGGESTNLTLSGHLARRVESRVDLERHGRVDVEALFRRRVEQALTTGESVNMNNQNHVTITQVLAKFIVASEDYPPGQIRVAYGDGSEAPPFPLRCLRPGNRQVEELVAPFSLMSMRHLSLDQNVVRNWLRNREIDQNSTLARADIYCYQHAVAEFRSLRGTPNRGQRLCLHLFHTGYEPAVVGVYRAAVEAMRDGGDWLRIVPHYYIAPDFVTGPSWPPLA